jgi:hypothetical protein
LILEELARGLFEKGPQVVTETLRDNGVEPRIYEDIQHLINEVVWRTFEPFIMQYAPPEELGFYAAYVK